MDFPAVLVPGHVELGVLLLQLTELFQGRVDVGPLGELHLVGEYWLQHRQGRGTLKT